MAQRLMLAVVAAAGLAAAAPAFAQQDESLWSGWYAGINLGGTWGHGSQHMTVAPGPGPGVIPAQDVATLNATAPGKSNPAGFAGGGEGGYNYKFRSSGLVLGLETDFDAFDLNQRQSKTASSGLLISPPLTYSLSQQVATNWIWTVRPRIGWAFGRWLVYGTGGMALADVRLRSNFANTFSPPAVASLNTSFTNVGWTAGGGVGFALTPQFSVKVEYLYTDLGTVNASFGTSSGFALISSSASARSSVVRMGVDYRF